MKIIIEVFILACMICSTFAAFLEPQVPYQNKMTLIVDNYYIYWNITEDAELILEARYHPKKKWIGFGLARDDSIEEADLFVAWDEEDETGHFSDRHKTSGSDELPVDKSHNWMLEDFNSNGAYKSIIVKRKLTLCNDEDIDIKKGVSKIIFMLGNNFEQDHKNKWNLKEVELVKSDFEEKCPEAPEPIKFDSKPTAHYSNQFDMIEGVYRLYWNFTDTYFFGEIHCKTKGWVGFGLR